MSWSGGLFAIGGEVFLNRRRLITKDVMHHLDPLPLVIGELHQLVLAHLKDQKISLVHSYLVHMVTNSPLPCDSWAI